MGETSKAIRDFARRILPGRVFHCLTRLRDFIYPEERDCAEIGPELVARILAADGDFRVVRPTTPPREGVVDRPPRIGIFGNVGNKGYVLARVLRRMGVEADLVLEEGSMDAFLFSRPFWEDLDLSCDTYEQAFAEEGRWQAPEFVRRVPYQPKALETLGRSRAAVRFVQETYAGKMGVALAPEKAFLLALHWDHWPMVEAMGRYDSVHLSSTAIAMGIFCPRPYVVDPIGGDLFTWPFEENLFGLITRASYRNAFATAVAEVNYSRYLDRLGIRRRQFLPALVDTEVFRPEPDPELTREWRSLLKARLVLFMTCRQSWEWKGNDLFFRALRKVVDQGAPVGVVAASWGEDLEKSHALVRELGLSERVLWLPKASKPRLRRYVSSADVAVDQFVMEGYGTSVYDAMACARPVLVWDDGRVYREAFDPPPPFLGATDEASIAQRLSEVVAGRHDLEAIGRRSREWVVRFHGPEELAHRIVALHREAIGPSGAGATERPSR